MKTALIIAYYFPPLGGGGVQRTAKFVRYLQDFDWHPAILSVSDPAFHVFDDTLLAELPPNLPIIRARAVEPTRFYYRHKRLRAQNGSAPHPALRVMPPRLLARLLRKSGRRVADWVLVPDEQIGWVPFAIRAGRELIARHEIDLIYSTSTPFSAHLVGARLKKLTGLPWVADFRDPFARNQRKLSASPLHVWLRGRLERHWVTLADRVVSTTSAMSEDFTARYAQLPPERWVTIPNGYDEHDFADLNNPSRDPCVFELHYVGSLYQGHTPDPLPLLHAIRCLVERDARAGCDFRLSFTGTVDAFMSERLVEGIRALGLADRVVVQPPVPHRDAIQRMQAASALLLMATRRPMTELIVHGKTYEYLRARRPILALNAMGAQRRLLEAMDAAVFLRADDIEGIYRQLQAWLDAWRCGTLIRPANGGHEQYERSALTRELARTFDEAVGINR